MAVTAVDAGPAVLEPGGGMGGRGMLNRRQQEEAKVKTDTTVLCAQVKLPKTKVAHQDYYCTSC